MMTLSKDVVWSQIKQLQDRMENAQRDDEHILSTQLEKELVRLHNLLCIIVNNEEWKVGDKDD